MALNFKQSLFIKEYLVDQNATRAAKAAGYSIKTAHAIGHKLLKNVEIKAEIEKALKFETQRIERRAAKKGLTKERWLEELRLLALSTMDDFVIVEAEKVKQGKRGKHYTVNSVRAIATKDRRSPKLGRVIRKISETKNGIGIELHSKQAALELLGRSYGWVKDDVNLNLPPVESVQVIITLPANGREAEPEKEPGDA